MNITADQWIGPLVSDSAKEAKAASYPNKQRQRKRLLKLEVIWLFEVRSKFEVRNFCYYGDKNCRTLTVVSFCVPGVSPDICAVDRFFSCGGSLLRKESNRSKFPRVQNVEKCSFWKLAEPNFFSETRSLSLSGLVVTARSDQRVFGKT